MIFELLTKLSSYFSILLEGYESDNIRTVSILIGETDFFLNLLIVKTLKNLVKSISLFCKNLWTKSNFTDF